MCILLARFCIHDIACGYFTVVAWGFPGVKVVFNLAFPFSDSHVVMGFFHLVELDCQMVLKLSEMVSGKFTRLRNPWIGKGGTAINPSFVYPCWA